MKRILAFALALAPTTAFAHPGHSFGLMAGLVHPLTGADHLLAMTGVDLWAALQIGRACWLLPLSFLIALSSGFGAAALGVSLPATEPAILASLILLGAMTATTLRAPLTVSLPLVALFGLAHSAAHSVEGAGPPFALGMLVTTAALLGLGTELGLTLSRTVWRAAGAATLLAGLGLTIAG